MTTELPADRAPRPAGAGPAAGAPRRSPHLRIVRQAPAEALVDRIYDAAADPELWDPTLGAVADALDSASCILVGHREGSFDEPRFGHFGRLEPELNMEGSRELFGASPFAPRLAAMAAMAAGRILSSDAILPLADARRTEWYREIMTPQGVEHCLMTTLLGAPGAFCAFFAVRGARRGAYTEEDTRRLDRLLPHLRRAAQIRCRLDAYRALAGDRQDVLDMMDTGVVVIDEAGAARCVNRAAEEVMTAGDGLRLRGSILSAVDPSVGAELQRLIALTAGGGCGAMLAIARRETDEPLLVLVCPLRGRICDRLARPRAAVALFLRDPAQAGAVGLAEALAQVYHLTPGETRVAAILAAGLGVVGTARQLALSPNTVKMHAKRVFEKMGLTSQVELAKLFGRLATPVRADATLLAA